MTANGCLSIADKRDTEPVFRLWVREKDEKAELWEGARSGTQAAMDVFNADEVCTLYHSKTPSTNARQAGDIELVKHSLPSILDGAKYIYTDAPASLQPPTGFEKYFSAVASFPDHGFGALLKNLADEQGVTVRSLRPLMSSLRVIKSDGEVSNMRLAGKLSGRAITSAMRSKWTKEHHLHSYLDYQFV